MMPIIDTVNAPMTETISNANAAASTLFLGHNGEWWDFWLIISVIIAALAATAIGVATVGSIVSHKREAKSAEEALDRYKLETEKKISEANERAEDARLEQERLKQLVKWRTVSPEDMKVLTTELAKGGGEIDIAFAPSDPESEYFALKIIGNDGFAAVNNSSGVLKWRVYLHPWTSHGMFFGIAIPGPENDQVKFLRRAFSAAHIDFSTENPPEEVSPVTIGTGLTYTPPPKHEALIVIGLKKPPL